MAAEIFLNFQHADNAARRKPGSTVITNVVHVTEGKNSALGVFGRSDRPGFTPNFFNS